MRPADALDRIVYLLDRVLAEQQKVQAFARARDIVHEVGDDEVERLHAAGKLTDLPGIGHLDRQGDRPGARRRRPRLPGPARTGDRHPAGRGAELALLRGDCHTHSTWSDGGASIEKMARTAMALGHEYMVLTDHSPRLTIAHGLNAERLRTQLDEVAALNETLAPFRILTGIEVDILSRRQPRPERRAAGPARRGRGQRALEAADGAHGDDPAHGGGGRQPHVDILGHCTGRSWSASRPPSVFDAEIVFAACAQFDTALEINCRPERQDPPDELVDLALEWDLSFAIDTDAHAPGQMEWQAYGCDKAVRHGIEPAQVVNAMGADDLVAWASTHAARGRRPDPPFTSGNGRWDGRSPRRERKLARHRTLTPLP